MGILYSVACMGNLLAGDIVRGSCHILASLRLIYKVVQLEPGVVRMELLELVLRLDELLKGLSIIFFSLCTL